MSITLNTLEDLERRLRRNPEYRKQQRLIKPYYDLVVQIIKRRSELKLSQKELAERAETYQSRVSKIESAEHDIRLSTLTRIAEALEAEVVIKLVPFVEDYQYREAGNYMKVFEDCLERIDDNKYYDSSEQGKTESYRLQTVQANQK